MTEIVDLDAPLEALKIQFPTGRVESLPLFTERVDDTENVLAVIRVTHNGRTQHQVYAITEAIWALVAIFGNYTDAMSEVLRWRRYIDGGGTVAAWLQRHPDGVHPERRGF